MKIETVKSITEKLDIKLKKEFVSVCRAKNPILKDIDSFTYEQKLQVLEQYSIFPKNILSLLVASTYSLSFHNWKGVVKELIQNINEELGEGEGDIEEYNLPHYTILRKVVKEGFEVDITKVCPSNPTSTFLQKIKLTLENHRPEFVCGAVYALESSAVPELTLVKELILNIASERGLHLPKLLLDFFDYHIDEIEIGHRDRFMRMTSDYVIDEKGWRLFENGFDSIMETMDNWWNDLKPELK